MTEPRPLPAPWSIIEHSESFEIQAANGQNLAYVYFEDENATRRHIMGRLTRDEAAPVAANIAKLPALLRPDVEPKE